MRLLSFPSEPAFLPQPRSILLPNQKTFSLGFSLQDTRRSRYFNLTHTQSFITAAYTSCDIIKNVSGFCA